MDPKPSNTISLDQIYEKMRQDDVKMSTKIPYSHPFKTKNKTINLSIGRVWFNTLLPDDFPLIDEAINKSSLDKLILKLIDKYGPEDTSSLISNIQKEAFDLSSINPRSFNINAFLHSDQWLKEREDFYKNANSLSDPEFVKESDKLTKDLMKEMDDKSIPIQDSIKAGITGKTTEATWKMLQVTKGHTVDIEGNINRITEGTATGYTVEDYYKAGAEGRSNFYIRSTAVAEPGYLARKVTMATANLKLTGSDCKTNKYLEIMADKDTAKKLIGRYYKDGQKLTLIENVDQILNQKIKLRSPIYCQQKDGICEKCYGQLSNKASTKNIGILAGGAINNEAINSMMKKRHMASQVNIVDVDFVKDLNKSSVDTKIANLILDIQPKKIVAKQDVVIYIDRNEYKDNELSDEGDYFIIPGILEVFAGDGTTGESIVLPYSFSVNLNKPENINHDKALVILNYSPGEVILTKDYYVKDFNPALTSKLLDGVTKYIVKPEILLDVLSNQLSKMDLVHLEVVISNMFRWKHDLSVPGRLVDYKDCQIIGCKQLPFVDSWLSALSFENINKAIKIGLVQNRDATFNPIEHVLLEKDIDVSNT